MNTYKKNYEKAKDRMVVAAKRLEQYELDYMASIGIVNQDGSVPKYAHDIKDKELAEEHIGMFADMVALNGMHAEFLNSVAAFCRAESNLVNAALSVLPDSPEFIELKLKVDDPRVRSWIVENAMNTDFAA